ncbi:ParB N-terminal domain-containing protein [Streptomyces sp. NPDC023838]|uniref:ParB N-terminal domain-containing protein n=1 Tax=Streptomyces sp. NPDC023838 TaxID=3154325 RepID=UPI0033E1219A
MSFADGRVPLPGPSLSAVETVPIGRLLRADSPRRLGENDEHIRLLAQSEQPLPPIVVHRPTMRVIDGMHRLQATRLRGGRDIQVRFYDGPSEDAFVLAVEANVVHGLPLSAPDRTAAAARIIRTHPNWSNRAIASVTGLSAKTVGAQRRRMSTGAAEQSARVGRDGRVRPVSCTEGRLIASRLIAENPTASLRAIAQKAGISPGTVRDVRERLKRGEDPVPRKRAGSGSGRARGRTAAAHPPPACDPPAQQTRMSADVREAMFRSLCRDPSLRLTETGRLLLRMMEIHMADAQQWERIADAVPAHCADSIAAMATACAEVWQDLASRLRHSASAPGALASLNSRSHTMW